MKRGKGQPRNRTLAGTTAKATKKKAQGAAGKAKGVVEEAVEEWKEAREGFPMAELDDWAGLWSGVDEAMSWATCWFPFWEMMAMEDAYDALYGDVLWDYDVWDLEASGNAPN